MGNKFKYQIMFFLKKKGIISGKTWRKYTTKLLDELLEENTDVLIRLKNI